MDLDEHRYYKFNKMLMKLFGQWPEQSTRINIVIHIIIMTICGTQMIPQLILIANNLDDLDLILEAVTSLIFCSYCSAKLFFGAFNSQKVLILLNRIRTDWEVWTQDRDVHILHEYTKQGRKITILYAAMTYAACTVFVLEPIIPKIVDVFLRNGTELGQFPIPVDYYYIDMQKYYYYIILHCFLCCSLGIFVQITYSCMFIVAVHHGCGLFSALGRKLQRIGKNTRSAQTEEISYAMDRQEVDSKNLAWCIDRHHDAIEYAKLIEATYSWCFFLIMGINVFSISMSGLQIVKKTVDHQRTVRFIIINLYCMSLLYFDNYMAQSLMDHSISIHYYLLCGEWYEFPLTMQKRLLLMLMRSNVPCKLTAGKITVLSIETFEMFLKTALSYFTLLRSV